MGRLSERMDLSGKLALVTGASSGLGEHFAECLAEEGASVILAARRTEKLEALKARLEAAGHTAFCVKMDVTDPASVDAAITAIKAEFDAPCDIVINNSGVGYGSWYYETSEEDWQSTLDTNISGVWRAAKAASKALIDAGKPGSIINIASITAMQPAMMSAAYAASKAAVDHLTRSMAVESARFGIRINAIAPGYYKTAINDAYLDSEAGQRMKKRIAMQRFGEYQELDGALVLLASDAASYMTGTTIVVDGGHLLMPL